MPQAQHQHHESSAGNAPLTAMLPYADNPAGRSRLFWMGLIRSEWYAQSRLVLFFLGAWLAMVWIGPYFVHPGWILAFASAYALISGPIIGGRDVLEGCEEYSFALPATRSELFLARWIFGASLLALFTVLDFLSLGLDVSQAMTRLYLDTGLMDPKGAPHTRMFCGLILAFPFSIFCFSFSLSANARGRALVASASLWSGLTALLILRIGLLYEFWSWKAWTGFLAVPALCAGSILAFATGWRCFRVKEVVQPAKPWNMPALWWVWTITVILSLVLAVYLLHSLGSEFSIILGKQP